MKSSLLLLALVGGAHAIPTMLKEDAAEATRRRATDAGGQHGMPAAPVINHRILAVAGSGSGSGSGSAGPKPDDFDPKSPFTSYIDRGACGPRGDDAKADASVCHDFQAMVIKKQNFGKGEVIHTDVDGCEYFAYTIYECELKAEIRPADASGSGSGSGSGSASGPGSSSGSGSGSDKAGCDGVANSWKAMGLSAVLKNLNPRLNAAGFSGAALKAAGFSVTELKAAGFFTTKSELEAALEDFYLTGDTSDIENWDVSLVEDFSYLFYYAEKFNADLSKWDVAQGTNFNNMFYGAEKFDADLSKWNVAKGTHFTGMFAGASSFNADLSKWNVAKGTSFNLMFAAAPSFNADLSKWDVAQGTNFDSMFAQAEKFDADLSKWNVVKGMYFGMMFLDTVCESTKCGCTSCA